MVIEPIAHIENAYTSKFGVPRQSGLVEEVLSRIVFEPEFRAAEALRGIEEFSHLWLIWGFHQALRKNGENPGREEAPGGGRGTGSAGSPEDPGAPAKAWSPTVRPPRLGGNERIGVFATRSPYRPNALGLSSVRLAGVKQERSRGTVLLVAGADLMNGTPIYDIKPYLPSADCHPDAAGGFTDRREKRRAAVRIPEEELRKLPAEDRTALEKVLAEDPRPAYQDDPGRVYAFEFAGRTVRFRAEGETLTVISIH